MKTMFQRTHLTVLLFFFQVLGNLILTLLLTKNSAYIMELFVAFVIVVDTVGEDKIKYLSSEQEFLCVLYYRVKVEQEFISENFCNTHTHTMKCQNLFMFLHYSWYLMFL